MTAPDQTPGAGCYDEACAYRNWRPGPMPTHERSEFCETRRSGGTRWFAPGYVDSLGNAHPLGATTVIREHADAAAAAYQADEAKLSGGRPEQIITVTRVEMPWQPTPQEQS